MTLLRRLLVNMNAPYAMHVLARPHEWRSRNVLPARWKRRSACQIFNVPTRGVPLRPRTIVVIIDKKISVMLKSK